MRRKKVVVIDPGHGRQKDPGAINVICGNPPESEYNLLVAKELRKAFMKNKDLDVYLTREDTRFVTLCERTKFSNEHNSDIFISLHHNSATCKTASGTEVCIYSCLNNKNKVLANKLSKGISSLLGVCNRGVKERPCLYVLKHTKAPAFLIELLFMSNEHDMKIAAESNYASSVADTISCIVEEYLRNEEGK